MKVWIDGHVVDGAEARVPVMDHGLLYGDGVFEGIRAYGGRVFELDRHLTRLAASARALALELPGGVEAVRTVVLDTLSAFGRPDAYVRLIVTRGDGPLGVDPLSCPHPRVLCLVDEVAIYPPDVRARGLSLHTVATRRPGPDVLDPRVKSLNYLPNVLAKHEARRVGADEALVLNADGHVAEAAVANVFALRDGVLRTPPATDGALEGIVRRAVFELAPELGFEARAERLDRLDLWQADEVLLTGTGVGIVPVRELDGRAIGNGQPGPVSEKLWLEFQSRARAGGVPFESHAVGA